MKVDYVGAVTEDAVKFTQGGRHCRIPFRGEEDLAEVLTMLRDRGLPFLQHAYGWEPGDVFADLRRRGLVSGTYDAIAWASPGETVVKPGL